MVTSCKISKIPNGVGKYSCQYVRNGKIIFCTFDSYESAINYANDIWELSIIDVNLSKSIVLVK